MKTVVFSPKAGKYLRIKSLSEQNGNHFTSIAELDVSGCIEKDITDVNQVHSPDINAYPIPASDKLTVSLPGAGDNTQWQYAFYSMSSGMVKSGAIYQISGNHTFNIDDINTGTYILKLTNERGQIFRIKLVKR